VTSRLMAALNVSQGLLVVAYPLAVWKHCHRQPFSFTQPLLRYAVNSATCSQLLHSTFTSASFSMNSV
jgi:hypothetical protein